jgi:uncharacterized protein YbjT (DUF2867 family)
MKQKPLRILVAGGSGFIGRRLIVKLAGERSSRYDEIICLSRRPESLRGYFQNNVRMVRGDVSNYEEMVKALDGVDVAYYLVHSMEGGTKGWKQFAERDRKAALTFAQAASACGVKRVIYLGGLSHGNDAELSEHMRSRREVGEILKTSSSKVTIFTAAVILGQGGGSFQMLQYLVERLPVMVCPKWVLTKSQPISVDDVVTYLAKALDVRETEGRTLEIGGPEVMTYVDMMTRYAAMLGKRVRILIIPFLTPRLSSYWVDLVTPVSAALARPLIDSLKHEATVRDDSVKQLIQLQPKNFERAITDANHDKEAQVRRASSRKERTSISINSKILLVSLLALVVFGSMYFILDRSQGPFQPAYLVMLFLWYTGIAFAIFFIRQGARLGAFVAGVVGWLTLAFWLLEGRDIFLSVTQPAIASSIAGWTDVAGILTVCVEIVASHNVFHKLRPS